MVIHFCKMSFSSILRTFLGLLSFRSFWLIFPASIFLREIPQNTERQLKWEMMPEAWTGVKAHPKGSLAFGRLWLRKIFSWALQELQRVASCQTHKFLKT